MSGKKRRRQGDPSIPTDTFGDIAFQLIIFFVVTANFVKMAGFYADLPSSKKGENSADNAPTVTLTGDKINWHDQEVTMKVLREKLADQKFADKEATKRFVMLKALPSVKHQIYFQVWAAIVKAGGSVAVEEGEGE